MFGYVKPYVPALRVWEYEYYKSIYCGLCRCMKKKTGTLSTFSLRYDFVFLVLVILALEGEQLTVRRRRCGVHPLKKRPMAQPHPALEYAAYVSALFTYYKAKDDAADREGWKSAAKRLLLPAAKHLRRRAAQLRELDFRMEQKLQQLAAAEREKNVTPDGAAHLFGEVLGDVFETAFTEENNRRIAQQIGYHVGKWIYFADAADDYPKDIQTGSYNPFAVVGNADASYLQTHRQMIWNAMTLECQAACRALDLAGLPENGTNSGILYHILYVGMPHMANEILEHPGQRRRNGLQALQGENETRQKKTEREDS